MISVNNVSFHFGARTLYDEASLHIKPKDRIGLIGPNGAGKSTLLRLLTGEYTPDAGTISRANDCTIGFLNQDLLSYQSEDTILHVTMQAFERALEVEIELEHVLAQMEKEYSDELLTKLSKLQEEYELLDGYTLQSRAEEILEGLGFVTADLTRPLQTFSGGWRMRVMLAKLLLQQPSLLMLDEPTNHLDLPSIQWIEQYITNYEGAIIVVSHDREFLNNVSNTIVEVRGGKFNVYAGNYEFFVEEKALRMEIQKGSYENQQAQIKQTERFIQRFKATASKAKQVQSRVKSLERIDLIDDVVDDNAKVHFRFNFTTQSGRFVSTLKEVSKSYGPLHILHKTHATIERGDKIALIGANGRGKSTLLRVIAGTEPIDGERNIGHNVIPAFFAQHQLESLNVELPMLEELKMSGTAKTEVELRTILGCFLFTADDVFKKIKVLSGGEKSRVALAKTLISEANFLLLDEPTNHLDIMSVNILIQALQQYQGTFVVVSHDRFFVSQVANKIWYIENQEIKEYPGTYDEYMVWMSERTDQVESTGKAKMAQAQDTNDKSKSVKTTTTAKPTETTNKKQLEKQLQETENTISTLEKEKKHLENQLADSAIYENTKKLNETQKKLSDCIKKLDEVMVTWESITEQIEK